MQCVFVFDTEILARLTDQQDRRVEFIWHSLHELNQRLEQLGSRLQVLHGTPATVIPQLALQLGTQAVFCNHDYEPDAVRRDAAVAAELAKSGIAFHSYKDQVIFEQSEILNGAGKPYAVFTPYKTAWLKKLNQFYLRAYPTERYFSSLAQCEPAALPTLELLNFAAGKLNTNALPTGESGAAELFNDFTQRLFQYLETRDFPSVKGVSYLSTHLRFGTISIRKLAAYAHSIGGIGAETWLA